MATAVSAEEYKFKYEALALEKNRLELEFGHKRAQFRQLYLEVEEKLKNEKELTKQFEIQLTDLTKKNDDLKSEIEGVRIAAQLNNEEQVSSMKSDHQEEIASLQHIYKEHAKENQTRLANQYEEERNKLVETIKILENKLREQEEENKSSIATVQSQQQMQTGLMSSLSSAFVKKVSNAGPPSKTSQQGPALDISQQQVQKDVDAWKSVVTPLEKEIASLKEQLEEAKSVAGSVPASNDQEIQEMKKVVESERSARTDLEMYVAVLNTQKGVLQEDTDKLKHELHNVCRLFEQEKMSLTELKQTWKLANEQFLDQQTKLSFELEQTKRLLTPQQLEHVSKEMRQHRVQNPPSPKAPLPVQQSFSVTEFDPLKNKSNKGKETLAQQARKQSPSVPRSEKQGTIGDSIFNALFPAASQARHFNEYMQEISTAEKPLVLSSSSDSDSDDDLTQAIQSQNQKRYNLVETAEEEVEDGLAPPQDRAKTPTNPEAEKKQPLKKSNSSGDILSPNMSESSLHEKSLSHGDVSSNTSSMHKTFTDEVDSKLSLNETGWSTVSDDYYSHACMMCQNYEKQLQRLQKELLAVEDKEKMLIDNVNTLQDSLSTEKDKLASLEKSIENTDIDTKSQISIYQTNQQEVDKQVHLLHSQFKRFQDDIVKAMKALSEERDRALAQAAEQQNTMESESATDKEEDLKTEIMFLKDRMMAEQVDREAIEGVLQQDLKDSRDQILHLQKEIGNLKKEHDEPLLTL